MSPGAHAFDSEITTFPELQKTKSERRGVLCALIILPSKQMPLMLTNTCMGDFFTSDIIANSHSPVSFRMTYIEEGLKKRRGERGIKDDEPKPDAPYDPLEELFKIDGRYRLQKNAGDEEGSVTNSAAMLTAIPEVDLGMEYVICLRC